MHHEKFLKDYFTALLTAFLVDAHNTCQLSYYDVNDMHCTLNTLNTLNTCQLSYYDVYDMQHCTIGGIYCARSTICQRCGIARRPVSPSKNEDRRTEVAAEASLKSKHAK